tara:strand:- start:34 stop:321 length:288 start_codon:yes stop_codon:yes gene_type:complete
MTQKEKIIDLKKQLAEAKEYKFGKTTYIHETNHLYCENGEMYIGYGNVGEDEKWVVYNTDQLFKDLPFIINQVVKENDKQQKMYLDSIKDSLKEI